MSNPLIATKTFIPPRQPNWIDREKLIQELDNCFRQGSRLVLISAPAGYGKTTLVAEWLAHSEIPAAWISLDEGDNDSGRFISYLVAALQAVHSGLGEAALALLQSPQPQKPEAILSLIVNDLVTFGAPFLLILDDYHTIHSQAVHAATLFLLDHLPPQGQLMIMTRADPPLAVSRLRGRGQLTELRMSDLRFSNAEAAQFIEIALGRRHSLAEIDALNSRAEGWAAGLQMAALALKVYTGEGDGKDISGFLHSFSGRHRYIMDYLVEEVLQSQPAEIQNFLTKTSILERVCGPLCDALLGADQPSGQSLLQMLEQANLFVIPLDERRQWYRYHQLFADLLYSQLMQTEPGLAQVLHSRASAWFEQNGWLDEAIEHALKAGEKARASELIQQAAEGTLERSEISTFLRWTANLPDETIISRPKLAVLQAWGNLGSGQTISFVEERLSRLEEDSPENAVLAAPVRSYICLIKGEIHRSIEHARLALEQLPLSEGFLRSLATLSLANAYLAEYNTEDGLQILEEAAQTSLQTGNRMVAVLVRNNLSEMYRKSGQLRLAASYYQQALDLAGDGRGGYLPAAARTLAGLGEIAREHNDLERAKRLLNEAIESGKRWLQPSAIYSLLPLARLRLATGDVAGAQSAIDQARLAASASRSTRMDDLLVDMHQAWLWIATGELEQAVHWADERQIETSPAVANQTDIEAASIAHLWKYECLVLARLRLAQEQSDKALSILEKVIPIFAGFHRTAAIIEAKILYSLALDRSGQPDAAWGALEEALSLARPGGYMRIFLDEGEPMIRLLKTGRLKASASLRPYIEEILRACTEGEAIRPPSDETSRLTPIPEKLTERENEVLRLLRSPLNVDEIAAELFVSPSTVRTHIKSIYAKLGVHSRMEAIGRNHPINP